MVLTASKESKSALEVVMEVTTPGVTCGDGVPGGLMTGCQRAWCVTSRHRVQVVMPAALTAGLFLFRWPDLVRAYWCLTVRACERGGGTCLTWSGLLEMVAWCATQPGLEGALWREGLQCPVDGGLQVEVTLRQGSADRWCAPASEDFSAVSMTDFRWLPRDGGLQCRGDDGLQCLAMEGFAGGVQVKNTSAFDLYCRN
ncbi:hypothetical protein F5Y18DRAFT_247745 [Xylariaceae sp. FL1019]|nr:hypothetical protein F5Y18DRAFT_247745 [Xylariaceae sp. FL1019]